MNHLSPDLLLAASIRGRGRLTLPKAARQRLSLAEGDQLMVVVGRSSIELVPADVITREELWYLTGEIRSRIEAAEEDVSSDRTAVLEKAGSLRETVRRLLGDSD